MHLQNSKEILEARINDIEAKIDDLKEKMKNVKVAVKAKIEKKINIMEAKKVIMENELDEFGNLRYHK